MGEHRAPQRFGPTEPGWRRGDECRLSMWSVARPLQKRAPNASPATRARISAMTWLAMSATEQHERFAVGQ
jgi:hypothetical protein